MAINMWSREELILALDLYLRIPFGTIHIRNHRVMELAKLIGRAPSSIAIRLTNFAACDPYHQSRGVSGMIRGKKVCQPIWDEFIDNTEELVYLSEVITARLQETTLQAKFGEYLDERSKWGDTEGMAVIKTRITQGVFRNMILANYREHCAISGTSLRVLLVASHIIPWAANKRERMNPENGICLSVLYDKAYDKGLIGIDRSYRVLFSEKLRKESAKPYYRKFFDGLEGNKISMPETHTPDPDFLERHLETVFLG